MCAPAIHVNQLGTYLHSSRHDMHCVCLIVPNREVEGHFEVDSTSTHDGVQRLFRLADDQCVQIFVSLSPTSESLHWSAKLLLSHRDHAFHDCFRQVVPLKVPTRRGCGTAADTTRRDYPKLRSFTCSSMALRHYPKGACLVYYLPRPFLPPSTRPIRRTFTRLLCPFKMRDSLYRGLLRNTGSRV